MPMTKGPEENDGKGMEGRRGLRWQVRIHLQLLLLRIALGDMYTMTETVTTLCNRIGHVL